jgi:signal transduction histidine kinase
MIFIYFFYGLAFFTLGTSLLFYPKKKSRFHIAGTLTFIAIFGILHGINEWIDMFKLIQQPTVIPSLSIAGLIILPVSFFFLFLFGTKSVSQLNKKYSALNTLPIFLFITWTIITTFSTEHFLIGNIWARYLLGIPATFLSSYALILNLPYFKKNIPSVTGVIKIAAGTFFFYGVFSGIIVPEAGFFPASFINDIVFNNNFGIPVQVFRTFCAIVLAHSMLSILHIFNWETGELHVEIAERKRLEQVREKLLMELEQKNRELEQILYVTSHDLRSPLVNIDGFSRELNYTLKDLMADVARNDDPSSVKKKLTTIVKEDISESLMYIRSSVNKMQSLLNGLLTLSRLGKLELDKKQINMNKMMLEISNTFEFRLNEARTQFVISELPACIGDEAQINQVFSNLIDNSLKYLSSKQPGIVKISGYKENGSSIYCVEDNGIGIAHEHQKKIFEIFHRLEPENLKGEGMGLSIVKKIVDRHMGKVWVESELGIGSKFYVSLPS